MNRRYFLTAIAGLFAPRLTPKPVQTIFTPITIQLSIDDGEKQWIESRRFDVREIAHWYGVSPELLSEIDRAKF